MFENASALVLTAYLKSCKPGGSYACGNNEGDFMYTKKYDVPVVLTLGTQIRDSSMIHNGGVISYAIM